MLFAENHQGCWRESNKGDSTLHSRYPIIRIQLELSEFYKNKPLVAQIVILIHDPASYCKVFLLFLEKNPLLLLLIEIDFLVDS